MKFAREVCAAVGFALVLALIGAAVSPAAAQEPTGAEPSEQVRRGIAPDSIETVDWIVAVVGDTAILYSEIVESIVQAGAQGEEVPEVGTPEFDTLARETLTNLVDSRILLQKAKETDIQVPPDQLDGETDRRFREIRNSFPTATDFQDAVTKSGRSLVQYRQWLRGQVRSQMMIDEFIRANRDNLPPVAITDEEVQAYFEENLVGQTRPASISIEQVVIEPAPGEVARDSSIALAQQVLTELRDGLDFEIAARQYSMDMSNREQGGDLGWIQRSLLVPSFADAAWAARTGQPVGPVATRFGYHIIRVDNVRGGERKIRHISDTAVDRRDGLSTHRRAGHSRGRFDPRGRRRSRDGREIRCPRGAGAVPGNSIRSGKPVRRSLCAGSREPHPGIGGRTVSDRGLHAGASRVRCRPDHRLPIRGRLEARGHTRSDS